MDPERRYVGREWGQVVYPAMTRRGTAGDYGQYPTYGAYKAAPEMGRFPQAPGIGVAPELMDISTYQPVGGAYPITQLPTYQPTREAYPEYRRPETGGITTQLQQTISERMRGAGTAGAESAIYQRGEERVRTQYEEGLTRIDEEMSARGLTGSGIHGESIRKLEEERQKSLADLSRQITIYGQEAIESAMGRGQQYVEYQAAEAAREVAVGERGWAGRTQERIRGYESEARAAQAKGASEQAAYQTAIAERLRAYESQARAAQAKNVSSMQKWQTQAELSMKKYQMELQKAQMLQQAKMQAYEIGREEYTKAYQSRYQASRDRAEAERYAREVAERKAREEWERQQVRIERWSKTLAGQRQELQEAARLYPFQW